MDKISAYLKDFLTIYGPNIIFAVLILYFGRYAAKIFSKITVKALEKARVDITLTKFLSKIVYYSILAAAVIAALNRVGIETSSIVAVLATAGLAVGLALKDSLSNFAAGVMIIIFKPFVIGNYVETAGTEGTVDEISIFTVKLKSVDNKTIVVPNSAVFGENIINYSTSTSRRVDIPVGVSYDSDIKKTKSVLTGIVEQTEKVLKDPAPMVVLTNLGDSSINFAIRAWVNTGDYWDAYFEMIEKVPVRLREEGIEIPFPQMDVHLKKDD